MNNNWNLPPGCSVNDIPGNSPEDEAFERFLEEIEDREDFCRLTDDELHAEFREWCKLDGDDDKPSVEDDPDWDCGAVV